MRTRYPRGGGDKGALPTVILPHLFHIKPQQPPTQLMYKCVFFFWEYLLVTSTSQCLDTAVASFSINGHVSKHNRKKKFIVKCLFTDAGKVLCKQ